MRGRRAISAAARSLDRRLRSCLIAIRFWILWFMRVLHGGGTDHGCKARCTSDGGIFSMVNCKEARRAHRRTQVPIPGVRSRDVWSATQGTQVGAGGTSRSMASGHCPHQSTHRTSGRPRRQATPGDTGTACSGTTAPRATAMRRLHNHDRGEPGQTELASRHCTTNQPHTNVSRAPRRAGRDRHTQFGRAMPHPEQWRQAR